MKFSNRAITLSAAVVVSLGIGIAIGTTFSFPNANAESKGFMLTGTLDVPGMNHAINRVEDKETGIVCYYYPKGMVFSCASKK
jgi:hypothetical protein